jgi:hypothetical protein
MLDGDVSEAPFELVTVEDRAVLPAAAVMRPAYPARSSDRRASAFRAAKERDFVVT